MVKSICLFLIFQCVCFSAAAQVMDFCSAITKQGQCVDHPRKFYFSSGNTADVYAVVRLIDSVACQKVEYKIYRETNSFEEIYMNSLFQDVKPDMKSFWIKISFGQELAYKIYLYTDSGRLITSGRIFVQEDY